MERKFGRFAITGLLRYVAILNAAAFIMYKYDSRLFHLIDLDVAAVEHGEIWRLATYIFIPRITSLLPLPDWFNAAMWTYFLWWVGDSLEAVWGAFRLNLFYLIGMLGTTIAAFFFGHSFSNIMLNSSVFFAFARYYPDVVIYFAYVLPVKVRWMAWVSGLGLLIGIVLNPTAAYVSAVLVALGNYLLFFWQQIWQEAGHRAAVSQRRLNFQRAVARGDDSLHRCEVCNRTENSDPDLEFRVAADGHEYCVDHLPGKST
ncbi:MAG TPA: hypothetical protein VG733_12845 [Chthoniobacteraceae bacterium]|nr:hypothetical protein [Chthoniobacteraceae bacterium]